MSTMTRRESLRTFVFGGALAPLALHVPARAASPGNRLRIACVGVAGKGWEDMIGASGGGDLHDIVALCDIDHRDGGEQPPNLGKGQAARPLGIGEAARKFPNAKRYSDFRKMLEQKDIDAVTVSTPDHMHATVALSAMALGKHVYVQKPLTQTVHESRVMAQVARAKGLVTQMGNQFHSSPGYRCVVKVIRDGVIGKIKAAHCWINDSNWPQGMGLPAGEDPVPEGIHWDLWIGVAKPRPYKYQVYHNFNWRGWQEFGCGHLGDMGCHVMDPVVWSLDLGAPRLVSARVSGVNDQSYPLWSVVDYQFPGTAYTTPEFRLTWYDGGQLPSVEIARLPQGSKLPSAGSIFVGEKGTLVVSHSPSIPRLYPQEDFTDYMRKVLKDMFAGMVKQDHYRMWTDAILAGTQANSHFGYAGPLNETVILGTIAQRIPDRKLLWDEKSMTFDNPAATALVRRQYRKGWEIDALGGV